MSSSTYITKDIISELLKLRQDLVLYHRESQTLEFKESYNYSGLAEYFRDFAAFANNKGGYLIFGVKDKPKRERVGMSEKSFNLFDKIDPEKISGFLMEDFSTKIDWEMNIMIIDNKKYGVFYVYESQNKPIICKKDEGDVLKNGEIYFRYGGRTQKIQYTELETIINHRIEQQNAYWMDLFGKIGRIGPQNAAVFDLDKGKIEKSNSQILVVDEQLLKDINWVKEGFFNEKEGEKSLKLVGQVQPVETIEVITKEKTDKLKIYPLSACELADAVLVKEPRLNKNEVWKIIGENGIKDNKDYSAYNYRNKNQEDKARETGVIPKSVPSIYKETAVDYIVKIYKSELGE